MCIAGASRATLTCRASPCARFTIVGLGYILSYWGGAETALKRKMALLNELSLVANPRFGVDWTIELILRRLLGFWDASYCLILLVHETGLELYLVSSDDPKRCQKVPVRSQSDVPFIDMSDCVRRLFIAIGGATGRAARPTGATTRGRVLSRPAPCLPVKHWRSS